MLEFQRGPETPANRPSRGPTMSESDTPPLLERMSGYKNAVNAATEINKWTRDIEKDIRELRWIAAGGRGMAQRKDIIDQIESQIKNLEALQEQVERLEDPRELREEARELERANHD